MSKKKIGIILGSLRKGSYSRSVANCLMENAPDGLELDIIEIGNLPLYNQDFDTDYPESYLKFKEEVKAADGLIFITPEHNRSIPAALKNALDVGSRPWGQSVWSGKPGAIISLSPGALSGFGANHHLRQPCSFLNIYMMSNPECYLGNIDKAMDENGKLSCERTVNLLNDFMTSYVNWISDFE